MNLSLSPHTHILESLNIPFKLHSESSPDTLPRKIPEPEEPGGVQSVGVQRARHDWRDSAHTHLVKRASQLVLVVKNPPANAEDIRNMGSIPGLGRSPGGGHGNPLQYSCLKNPHGQRRLWFQLPKQVWCYKSMKFAHQLLEQVYNYYSVLSAWTSIEMLKHKECLEECVMEFFMSLWYRRNAFFCLLLCHNVLDRLTEHLHFSIYLDLLLDACVHAKLFQSCPALCDAMVVVF